MTIVEDVGQKIDHHEIKHNWFKANDIQLVRVPLPVGDYILYTDKVEDVIRRKQKRGIDVKKMDFLGSYDVCVDTKKDMMEIYGNICNSKDHARLRDEIILAQNNGIKLYILVENEDGIAEINDVVKWRNPRIDRYEKIELMHSYGRWKNIPLPKRKPRGGESLMKSMKTMSSEYGCEFCFCRPNEAGARIIELLTGG